MRAASARRLYQLSQEVDQAAAVFPAADHYGTTDRTNVVRIGARRDRYFRYLWAVLSYLWKAEPAIIVFGKASPYSFIPAILYRMVRPVRLVFDCDEWDPATVADTDAPAVKTLVYQGLAAAATRIADVILISNNNILDELPESVHGRCTYVPNGASWEKFGTVEARPVAEPFTITYVGSLQKMEQIRPVIDALPHLQRQFAGTDWADNFRVEFVGPGDLGILRERVSSDYVEFPGPIPHDQVQERLARSHVHLAVFGNIPSLRYASNVKLFEYMATGRPIVASDVGEIRYILEDGQAGYIVDPDQPQDIASAIASVARDPDAALEKGQRARQLVWERYRWKVLAWRVARVVDELPG